jgi:hypothetical protein
VSIAKKSAPKPPGAGWRFDIPCFTEPQTNNANTPHTMLTIKRLIAALAIALTALLITVNPLAALAVLFVSGAAIAGPHKQGQFGAAPDTIEIASELQLNEILDSALTAFQRAIMPLRAFSTVFQNVTLRGTNKVEVPYYPLQGVTSKDFNGTYNFATGAGGNVDKREIIINKRKYQPIALTSEEIARYPLLSARQLGEMKGQRLAYDIIQDVMSVITAANFGAAVHTGAAGNFDSDDVIDIRTDCNNNKTGPASVANGVTTNTSTTVTSATARFNESDIGITISGTGIPANTTIASVTNSTTAVLSAAATADGTGITFTLGRPALPWPEMGRSLVLNPSYDGALLKDDAFKSALAFGTDAAIREGRLPSVFGFGYAQSAAIPANGENLVGFAAYMSAILFGQAPITPADGGRTVDYRVVTDEQTGIAIEYREWFDPDTDTVKRVIEGNYGYAKGEEMALKRIVSA